MLALDELLTLRYSSYIVDEIIWVPRIDILCVENAILILAINSRCHYLRYSNTFEFKKIISAIIL